jgi:DNA invertase Pin-like site-specific DNA recombinase
MQAKATKKSAETPRVPGKLIGYARVSTTDQDLSVQREALERAGVGVIFEEKASGTKREGRTELQKVLSVLGKGDTLVVTRLDRLGCGISPTRTIKVIEQSVDTSSAAGRAFFGMLAVFAAFGTDVRRERQLEGIAVAKREGIYKGGKPRLDRMRVKELSSSGLGPQPLPANSGWRAAQSTGSSAAPCVNGPSAAEDALRRYTHFGCTDGAAAWRKR